MRSEIYLSPAGQPHPHPAPPPSGTRGPRRLDKSEWVQSLRPQIQLREVSLRILFPPARRQCSPPTIPCSSAHSQEPLRALRHPKPPAVRPASIPETPLAAPDLCPRRG